MAIDYNSLKAYIDGLNADGTLSTDDYNKIVLFILANGDVTNSPRDLIQIRRGNEENLPILAQGEMGYCLDKNKLVIGGINGNTEINSGFINVKNYGATGDGTTDDTNAILSAIIANPQTTLYFPKGDYKVVNLNIPQLQYTSFVGDGASSIINGNINLIATTSIPLYATFKDIAFSGNTLANGEKIFNQSGYSQVTFINVTIANIPVNGYGFYIKNTNPMSEINFFNCLSVTANAGKATLYLEKCYDVIISDCIFSNWTNEVEAVVKFVTCDGIIMTNTHIWGGVKTLVIDGAYNFNIANCFFDNPSQIPVEVLTQSGPITALSFNSCFIVGVGGSYPSIKLDSTDDWINYVKISKCTFNNAGVATNAIVETGNSIAGTQVLDCYFESEFTTPFVFVAGGSFSKNCEGIAYTPATLTIANYTEIPNFKHIDGIAVIEAVATGVGNIDVYYGYTVQSTPVKIATYPVTSGQHVMFNIPHPPYSFFRLDMTNITVESAYLVPVK